MAKIKNLIENKKMKMYFYLPLLLAHLIGKHQGKKNGSILMVMSMPYRCQQERELGFRNVIRSKYPNLRIKESIFSLDTSEESYKNVKKFIKENGAPLVSRH